MALYNPYLYSERSYRACELLAHVERGGRDQMTWKKDIELTIFHFPPPNLKCIPSFQSSVVWNEGSKSRGKETSNCLIWFGKRTYCIPDSSALFSCPWNISMKKKKSNIIKPFKNIYISLWETNWEVAQNTLLYAFGSNLGSGSSWCLCGFCTGIF